MVQERFTLWFTVPNPATTGALPKLMVGVVIWQSLLTVRVTVRVWFPAPVSRPRHRLPRPMPEQ
ncbi:hypothetical protein D3C73_1518010 [compost metagenome]